VRRLKLLYLDFFMPYLLRDANYPVGGATVEWYAWLKGFIANNQKVGVLTFKGAKEYINKQLEFDIVETYGMDEGIPKLRLIYRRYPALLNAVREYNPDYLIQECADINTGLMACIGRRLKIPFVYRVANDMDTDERYKARLSKWRQIVYQFGLKHADTIICQNNYQYESLKKRYDNKRISVIHNPFHYEGDLTAIRALNERRYVAWLGIFQHQKNLPVLLEIVRCLRNVEFRIAGKEVNSTDLETKKALNSLAECNNVKFVGYLKRTEIFSFLSNAYALLNTSHYEGFSNTFLESFLSGTPVVTTEGVDPDNIIRKNNLGKISKNYYTLPDLITSLINGNDYEHITRRCRQYVLKEHNPELLARKFIESIQ